MEHEKITDLEEKLKTVQQQLAEKKRQLQKQQLEIASLKEQLTDLELINLQQAEDSELLIEVVTEHSDREGLSLWKQYKCAEKNSFLDGLTNIANRRSFDNHWHNVWQFSLRAKQALALMMIDVDFFKAYNDYYGHVAGDRCLQQIASIINGAVYRKDDYVARYGGEEFAVILSVHDIRGVKALAYRIRAEVCKAKIEHAGIAKGYVTVSLGCGMTIPKDNNEIAFIEKVDALLYRSKQQGRNKINYKYFKGMENEN